VLNREIRQIRQKEGGSLRRAGGFAICPWISDLLKGTGSQPQPPQGWHLQMRFVVIIVPRKAPWRRIASKAYVEQLGSNRHCPRLPKSNPFAGETTHR